MSMNVKLIIWNYLIPLEGQKALTPSFNGNIHSTEAMFNCLQINAKFTLQMKARNPCA